MTTRISSFARAYGRKRAGARMEDVCRIERPGSSKTVYDPVTRKVKNVTGTPVYEGVCRLWEVASGGRTEINGQQFTVSQTNLSLPWDAPIPEPDDRVYMLDSVDPRVVGRSLMVVSVTRGGGLRASRRMTVVFTDFAGEGK